MIKGLPLPEVPELKRNKFYNSLRVLPIKGLPTTLHVNYVVNRLDCKELQKYIFCVKRQNNRWNQILDNAWNN